MRKFRGLKKREKKFLVGVSIVFFLATVFRVITERAFLAGADMESAFSVLAPEESRGTVTLTGRYLPPPYGFSGEKLLAYFGEHIGLKVDGSLREVSYDGRSEYVYEKYAAEAHSVLKLVHLTEADEYYICAEIVLSGENSAATADLRRLLQREANAFGLSAVTTTLELCGIYNEEIPLSEKDRLTDLLLSELYAQPVYENRENANYTVYAYTGAVEEFLTVEQKKINVQVAFYYDRERDCTEVVLASPLGLR